MLSQSNKSAFRSGHHDFDNLKPAAGVTANPARPSEIPQLAALARSAVPGVTLSATELETYCAINPRTAFGFARNGHLLGGIAFLFLNDDGLDALMLDGISLGRPQPRFLAAADETPAAIYWWALAAKGRGLAGLGDIARLFASPQYRSVDFYAQPSSADGLRILQSLGFDRVPSWQPDLWTYQRVANRKATCAEAHLRQAA
jgi:hypothetical protein